MTENVSESSDLLDGIPVSLSEIIASEDLDKRKFVLERVVCVCNLFNDFQNGRVVVEDVELETGKLLACIEDITGDSGCIDGM